MTVLATVEIADFQDQTALTTRLSTRNVYLAQQTQMFKEPSYTPIFDAHSVQSLINDRNTLVLSFSNDDVTLAS